MRRLATLTAVALSLVVAATVTAAPVDAVAVVVAGPADGGDALVVDGVRRAAAQVGARVALVPDVAPAEAAPVLRRLAQEGARLIVVGGPAYSAAAADVAAQFHVPVLVATPVAPVPGVLAGVEVAAEQGGYLAGVAAGKLTRTQRLGLAVPPGDATALRTAGGFAAGARSVNADVHVGFGGLRADTDVVLGVGSAAAAAERAVEAAAPRYGAAPLFVAGDPAPFRLAGPSLAAAVVWDYAPAFRRALDDVAAGAFGTRSYRVDAAGGISLLRTAAIPPAVWARVERARRDLAAGTLVAPRVRTRAGVLALAR